MYRFFTMKTIPFPFPHGPPSHMRDHLIRQGPPIFDTVTKITLKPYEDEQYIIIDDVKIGKKK
jgi:hypothetical protein